ncbi:cellulose binding domain-containing protein [Micromonospora sp. NBC_01655]|uniref:cellulose binding domain-containing protein n=1 Tax=Micromonospora sp. NBC_01655 TaxID=2975983 RepID=UPI00225197E6|nr:cellulose binding domain-containing protein [Micromonospora sp. NBC_01655]MCX4471199.1 cellulose binding domain-containing protein [Micromonospora sp. NBC_01655]
MSGTRRARPAPATSAASAAIASSPWILVSVGVIVMVVLLLVALGTYRSRGPAGGALPGPDVTVPLPTSPPTASRAATGPPAPVPPGRSPRSTPSPGPTRPAASTGGPTPAGAGTSASPPAPLASTPVDPPALTGAYRVLSTYDDAFIGEVLVRNVSRSDQGWAVRLTFPGARLVAVWVAGAPEARTSRSGDTWTFTGGGALPPDGVVPLRFHFEQTPATRPTTCTVDGVGCSGVG